MKLRALLILYRRIGIITLPVTLLMWGYAGAPTPAGMPRFMLFLMLLFWLRTPVQLVIWYLYKLADKRGLYFFFHFGFSEIQLILATYLLDLCVLTLVITFAYFVL